MPTYDYKCPACGATTEVRHSMAELDAPSAETVEATTCYCTDVWEVSATGAGLDVEHYRTGTRMLRFLAGAPAFGKIASMSPQQRQQVLKQRSREHFQQAGGRDIQRQKLEGFARATDKRLGLA